MSEVKKEKTSKKTTKKVAETKKETKVKSTKKKTTVSKDKALLTKKDQSTYKGLSKAVRILAKIGRVCLMIFVPFIVLSMILIPIIFNKFEMSANVIKFGDASVVIRDTGLSFKIGDKIHVLDCNTEEVDRIITYFSNHSKGAIIFSLELSLLILAAITILEIYLLSYLEKLFGNFEKENTPFTKENTDYILVIAKFLIAIEICSICMSCFGLFNGGISSIGIFEILIVFIGYYVFKYATGMQKEINTKIYE